MAVCMMCHRKIPNGKKYCEECEIIAKQQADESYLDNLLNSVSTNRHQAPAETTKKAKSVRLKTADDYIPEIIPETDPMADLFVESSDENFEGNISDSEMDDMLNDLLADMDESDFGDGTDEEPETDIEPDDLADIFSEAENAAAYSSTEDIDELLSRDIPAEETSEGSDPTFIDDGLFETIDESVQENENYNTEVPEETDDFRNSETPDENIEPDNLFETEPAATDEAEPAQEDTTGEQENLNEFENSGLGPGDLAVLNGEDNSVVNVDWGSMGTATDISVDPEMDSLFEEVTAENLEDAGVNDDLNSILGLDGSDDELDRIMNDISNGDFGKDTDELLSGESPEEDDDTKGRKKKDKADKPPKKSLWKRLFGNKLDKSPEEILEDEKKEEEAAAAKKEKAEQDKVKAEEKKKQAEEEKARAKAEAEIAKKAKEAQKAAKKAEEKEKARKKKEEALALAEFEVEHGRINRAGATILFIIFAILTIIIIIGTNIYSYNLSIEHAQEDFNIQKYNEAYYEVYGLEIQDEDIVLYDQIMTVMYVNTQLNSYEYYMTSNNREKALDSLLKGLERYDKYYKLASYLDISDDLDYVRTEILTELDKEFNLTKDQAYGMITIDDSVDYSDTIYKLLGSYEDQLNQFKTEEK